VQLAAAATMGLQATVENQVRDVGRDRQYENQYWYDEIVESGAWITLYGPRRI